jgi:RimJ/RimL family protein N-acetyltransferase
MFQVDDLIFRKVFSEDLNDLLSLKQESWLQTHHVSFLNETDQQNFFQRLQSSTTQPKNILLIACAPDNAQPIGMFYVANIDYLNRTADVGWALYAKYRGKQLGKKLVCGGTNICFQILNLKRLNCEILCDNHPSMKCAKHSLYVQEGIKRESVFKLGKYLDSIVFGVLVEDFPFKEITSIDSIDLRRDKLC